MEGNIGSPGGSDKKDSKKTILLIEDDTVLAQMYSQRLLNEGYNVLVAQDGEEGIDIALKEKINLVLTDIMLPRVSGIEFIQKFRKNSKKADIPIIAWSNLADESDRETALKFGAKEYLVKGKVTLDEITQLVYKYLS